MQFTTVLLLNINSDTGSVKDVQNHDNLKKYLRELGYNVFEDTLLSTSKEDIKKKLRSSLKDNDVVVVIGFCDNLYNAAGEVYCKHKVHRMNFDVSIPKDSIWLSSTNGKEVLRLHRLFILHGELSDVFLALLRRLREPSVQTNVYVFESSIKNQITHLNGVNVQTEECGNNFKLKASGTFEELSRFRESVEECVGSHFNVQYLDKYENEVFQSIDPNVQFAISCIEKCFTMYGPENVFISFNGGKDCTVLLHMMLSVLKRQYPNFKGRVFCMYVKSTESFPQVDRFIRQVADFYNINVLTVTSSIRNALQMVLDNKPNLRACLMGTRRMDPFSENLQNFTMTDGSWPQVMRVSPILDWDYANVWDYLFEYKVPYCPIYDEGYTSLGNVNNTVKNPELRCQGEDDSEWFLPAYKLCDGSKERLGRQ